MGHLDEAVSEYIRAIKNTEEYQDYQREKELVKQFPELKAQIDEYRRRRFELHHDENAQLETVEEFAAEYAAFLEIPQVADFLAAELALCRLMQEADRRVVESLKFE